MNAARRAGKETMTPRNNTQGRGRKGIRSAGMLVLFCIAAVVSLSPLAVCAKDPAQGDSPNYLAEGNRYRSNGECEKALESYAKARDLRQFLHDESYFLSVADCYVVLRKYDQAIEAYTRAIEGTRNKALLSEMYRNRGRAYYLKAARGATLDMAYLELARRDLREAAVSGADVADIEKSIVRDLKVKKPSPAPDSVEHLNTVTGQEVDVIESSRKIVVGGGKYVVHLSRDTRITDKDAHPLTAFDIKPGDVIDFTYANGYRNTADEMMHVSSHTVTLHRSVPLRERADIEVDRYEEELRKIVQKIGELEHAIEELREQQEKRVEEAPPAVPHKETVPGKKPKQEKPLPAKKTTPAKTTGEAEKASGEGTEELSRKYLEEPLEKIRQQYGSPPPKGAAKDIGERSPSGSSTGPETGNEKH